jgi:hypothetical protein
MAMDIFSVGPRLASPCVKTTVRAAFIAALSALAPGGLFAGDLNIVMPGTEEQMGQNGLCCVAHGLQ